MNEFGLNVHDADIATGGDRYRADIGIRAVRIVAVGAVTVSPRITDSHRRPRLPAKRSAV